MFCELKNWNHFLLIHVFDFSELKKSQGLTLELKDKLQEVADEKTSLEDARHQLEEAQRNLEDAVKMEQSERERIVCWKQKKNKKQKTNKKKKTTGP